MSFAPVQLRRFGRDSFTSNDGVTRYGRSHLPSRMMIRSSFTSNDGVTYYGAAGQYKCIWEGATDATSDNSVTPLINALVVAGFAPAGVTKKLTGGNNKFGPKVTEAVKKFQADRGLLVDGVGGKGTWKALNAAAPDEINDLWLVSPEKCPPGAGDYLYGTEPPKSEDPETTEGGSTPFYTPPQDEKTPTTGGGDDAKKPDEKQKLWDKPWFWPAVSTLGVLTIVGAVALWPKKAK